MRGRWFLLGLMAACGAAPPVVKPRAEAVLPVTLPARAAHAWLWPAPLVEAGAQTWLSADHSSITLAEGVLIATRGLGHDLMAADGASTLAALRRRSSAPYDKRYSHLDGQERSVILAFSCIMAQEGASRRERCHHPEIQIENSYVLGAAGAILVSRQWISAELGYLEIGAPQWPSAPKFR